jgi:IS30 family transposase
LVARAVTEQDRVEIWDLVMAGGTHGRVAKQVGLSRTVVHNEIRATGGVRPATRCRAAVGLTLAEREDIAAGVAAQLSVRAIAGQLGRAASTVSRELRRNGGREQYRPSKAEAAAWARAARPKPCKLALNPGLREHVEQGLLLQWSPEQITGWLKVEFPDDPELRVSHETIYLSLFVQSKGLLRKELSKELRSGRGVRRAGRISVRGQGRGQIVDALHISERPAEADDRAVPGHWEGDMVSGTANSHVATLVERSSRFVLLVKLENKTTDCVIAALTAKVQELPEQLKRSLTWDRGLEMAKHKSFTVDTGVQVYFCDPKSPWQRGTNENTNGLLRQYLPHGTNMRHFTQEQLDEIAARLNGRPRKTLEFMTPSQKLSEALP